MTIFLWIFSLVLVAAGIAGAILPALPGVPLVFFGLATAAWIDGFQRVGWLTLAFLALLTVMSLLMDILVSAKGAQQLGAGRAAVTGALIGAIAGLFFGLPGLILGPFVGAFAGEYLAKRDLLKAGKAGFGAWIGLLGGIVLRLSLSLAMVAIFAAAYFID
ncbi:MAG: DUF456 family protein [Geobacteraceae bacterium]|nr:DUF456 family protein [Geobacteraceae bacterium]